MIPHLGADLWMGLRGVAIGVLLLGLAWPAAMVGALQVLAPDAANGSLIQKDGAVVGSELAAQPFADPRYLRPRPSAVGHDPKATGGSNLAASNPALREAAQARAAAILADDGVAPGTIPADALTASGGGLDPHISTAYAAIQVPRIARARGLTKAQVQAVLDTYTSRALGAPRVHVLRANLALDDLP